VGEQTELQERIRTAILEKIKELTDAQYSRAVCIEKALKAYEKSIRIRSVSDYISLSQHQRRCIGIADVQKVEHTGSIAFKLTGDQRKKIAKRILEDAG
jgi:hypothetical protein